MHWDIILFSETNTSPLDAILDGGHRLICYRDEYYAFGVGILIHQRWLDSIRYIHRISDRVLAIDIQMQMKIIRFISIYLPHAGFAHSNLLNQYDAIFKLVQSAKVKSMGIVLGGDFNTQYLSGPRGS